MGNCRSVLQCVAAGTCLPGFPEDAAVPCDVSDEQRGGMDGGCNHTWQEEECSSSKENSEHTRRVPLWSLRRATYRYQSLNTMGCYHCMIELRPLQC